jgi:HK97 family phage major capsid protein
MTLKDLIERTRNALNAKIEARNALTLSLNQLRLSDGDPAREAEQLKQRGEVDAEIKVLRAKVEEYEAEQRNDEAIERLQAEVTPAAAWRAREAARDAEAAGGATLRGDGHGVVVERSEIDRNVFVRTTDRLPAAVARNQRTADHPVAADMIRRAASTEQYVIGQHGDLGQLVRAMSTSSGSAIVPTVWAADVIDRARNLSAVTQAGAQLVPMDAKTVQIGRLTGDPTAAFRAEGSTITASDVTLDNVTLTATTMNALVVGSMEWFQDAPNSNELVSEAIAQAMATQLDLVCLYGSITSGAGSINLPTPSNPRGILAALNATAPSSVLGGATNGTTQTSTTFWNEILDLLYTPRDYNEQPNALIWNSKAARLYAKAYDTTGQPLQMPAEIAALQRYTSNQVPSYTQGTMTSVATDVFCGDFSQLLIGQRLDLTLQVLSEAYATSGQIGILATWRGDVGLARPRAFSVYKAIKGA